MRLWFKIVIVSISALMLGVLFAYPLFSSNVNVGIRGVHTHSNGGYFSVDVVFAYFSAQPVDGILSHLYKARGNLYTGEFLVVLNVTNPSNVAIAVNAFSITAAQEVFIEYKPNHYSERVSYPFFEYQQTYSQSDGLSDADMIWKPYESRLIALSGFTQFRDITMLQTGTFYIGSSVIGLTDDGMYLLLGAESKMIQVKNFGDAYLYSNLITEKETLRVFSSDLIVDVVLRS